MAEDEKMEIEGFEPREYQRQLFEQATKENVILYLPTGAGKTHIAVMVLRHFLHELDRPYEHGGKRSFFLVNTVALVAQQAALLERTLAVDRVGQYTGDMNVDYWDQEIWNRELQTYKISVMTCEIFSQLLLKTYLRLESVSVLVFDECHHAVEDHPMRQIMMNFENCPPEKQPRVVGLTATLLNGTPKEHKIMDEIRKLEVSLHSRLATVDTFENVLKFSTNPQEFEETYHKDDYGSTELFLRVSAIVNEMQNLASVFDSPKKTVTPLLGLRDYRPMNSTSKKSLKNGMQKVVNQYDLLGIYGAHLAALAVMVTLTKLTLESSEEMTALKSFISSLSLIRKRCLLKMAEVNPVLQPLVFCSSKVKKLIYTVRDYLKAGDSHTKIIVFVEERMTAKILSALLRHVSKIEEFSIIKADFIVGVNASYFGEGWACLLERKCNERVIQSFKEDDLNVLVCSDVIEEGVDIPLCNMVVRFDQIKSFRSYVQSKGRARSRTSKFIIMAEKSELPAYMGQINYFRAVEQYLRNKLVGKTSEREAPSEEELNEMYEKIMDPYVTPIGATVTPVDAPSLLNRYCGSLTSDKFSTPSPFWWLKHHRNVSKTETVGFTVCVSLPKVKVIIEGPVMDSVKNAQRGAALKMCEYLHKCGELTDSLLPNQKALNEDEEVALFPFWIPKSEDDVGAPPTGSKKRIRLIPTLRPSCFSGSVLAPGEELYLCTLEIQPVYDRPSEQFYDRGAIYDTLQCSQRNFGILSRRKLSNVCDFPVFLKFGELRVNLVHTPYTKRLTRLQYQSVVNFQRELFQRIVPSLAPCDFDEGKMTYAVVPMLWEDSWLIDWDTITSKVPEITRPTIAEQAQISINCDRTPVVPWYRPMMKDSEIYIVTKVCGDKFATDMVDFSQKTFAKYFEDKYGVTIINMRQPLLRVYPLQLLTDCLKRRHTERYPYSQHPGRTNDLYMPQELCVDLLFPADLWIKATCLPSVLHRLERLLIANDFRIEIVNGTGLGVINGRKWEPLKAPAIVEQFNQTMVKSLRVSAGLKRRKQKQDTEERMPWGNKKIKSLEREFDNITRDEIKQYVDCFSKKSSVSVPESPFIERNIPIEKVKLPAVTEAEYRINILHLNSAVEPELNLLYEALTAHSADDIVNLERLETLGDSFLKFAGCLFLYTKYPLLDEGKLTNIKGKLVGNKNLFYCGEEKRLGCFLKVSQAGKYYPPGFSVELGRVSFLPANSELNGNSQYQNVPDKTVADSVESIIGVYLSGSGVRGALTVLGWFKVLPQEFEIGTKKLALMELLNPSAIVHRDVDQSKMIKHHLSTSLFVEEILEYEFNDKSLLLEALTHCSYKRNNITNSYERLEFLGDAILDFLITARIFEQCGALSPGDLTDLRSALVNNVTFACLCVRYKLYKFMLIESVKLIAIIDSFVKYQENRCHVVDDEIFVLCEESDSKIADTVEVPKVLGDLFESLAGAIYLDSGKNLNTVWKIFYRLMKNEIAAFSKQVPKNVVRRFYEELENTRPEFKVEETKNSKVLVTASAYIGNEIQEFHGFGDNKKSAKKAACKLGLRAIVNYKNKVANENKVAN